MLQNYIALTLGLTYTHSVINCNFLITSTELRQCGHSLNSSQCQHYGTYKAQTVYGGACGLIPYPPPTLPVLYHNIIFIFIS